MLHIRGASIIETVYKCVDLIKARGKCSFSQRIFTKEGDIIPLFVVLREEILLQNVLVKVSKKEDNKLAKNPVKILITKRYTNVRPFCLHGW